MLKIISVPIRLMHLLWNERQWLMATAYKLTQMLMRKLSFNIVNWNARICYWEILGVCVIIRHCSNFSFAFARKCVLFIYNVCALVPRCQLRKSKQKEAIKRNRKAIISIICRIVKNDGHICDSYHSLCINYPLHDFSVCFHCIGLSFGQSQSGQTGPEYPISFIIACTFVAVNNVSL